MSGPRRRAPGERPLVDSVAVGARARSVEELQALDASFHALPRRSVDSQAPLLAAVVRARADVEAPYVCVSPSGRSALCARLEQRRIGVRVAFRSFGSFRARIAAVVDDGIVGDDPEWCVQQALGLLAAGEVDAVQFQCLRVGSVEEAAVQRGAAGRTVQREDPVVHLEVAVDCPNDELVASRDRRSREGIRRSRRKFDQLGERRVITRWPADADDPEVLLGQMEAIAATGYQRGMGVGFERDALHEELVRAGLKEGWFRAWVAAVDGVPAVFWTAFAFGDRWTLYETAFAEQFADAAPGAGLLSHVVEDACADPQVTTVGFGLGEARYKRDWASHEWMTADVTVFAPRLRWKAVAAVQRGASWAVTTVRQRLGEERVQALKQRLRRRAAGSARRDAERSG